MQRRLIVLSALTAITIAVAIAIKSAADCGDVICAGIVLIPGILPLAILPESAAATICLMLLVVLLLVAAVALAWIKRRPMLTIIVCILVIAWPVTGYVRATLAAREVGKAIGQMVIDAVSMFGNRNDSTNSTSMRR